MSIFSADKTTILTCIHVTGITHLRVIDTKTMSNTACSQKHRWIGRFVA